MHSSLAPWCLKAAITKYEPDVECEVLELTINEQKNVILSKIMEKEFDIIGFSTYVWNIEIVLALCKEIKKARTSRIVLGGPEVSYNAHEILEKYPVVDYIISGEGERPFADLCGDKPLENIGGLCYRNGDKIIIKEPYVSNENPPSPYTEDYFTSLNGRIAYIETSRGCPYRCAFCLSGRCGGVRLFDVEEAKKNILLLATSGAKTIKFIDRTFNADRKRAKELFAFIIDNYGKEIPHNTCFHFEIEGDILDEKTISLLSKAECGAIQMEIGLQSFNEQTLISINRKPQTQRICENVKKLIALGNIHIHIDLIAGLPYENYESFANSFNRALELEPHMLQFGFLKLLHGSDLKENMSDYCECLSTPPYEVISTKWLSKKELEKMHTTEDFFDRFYNSGRFTRTARYLNKNTENPFKIYTELGEFVKNNEKERSLDSLSLLVYEYLCRLDSIDADLLRDYMAIDRLASNRMGTLPEFLKIHSSKIKQILAELDKDENTRRKFGVKRAITLLKSENSAIYVDYDIKNPVTGEYKLSKIVI